MKNLIVIMVSILMAACGGSGDGGSNGSGGSIDQNLGTYAAEIKDGGGTILRSFNILVESDAAVTSGPTEDKPFYQLRDEDNVFSRYRYMRMTTSINLESDYETESIQILVRTYGSMADCLDDVTGPGSTYIQLKTANSKYSGGGSGTYLTACKEL